MFILNIFITYLKNKIEIVNKYSIIILAQFFIVF